MEVRAWKWSLRNTFRFCFGDASSKMCKKMNLRVKSTGVKCMISCIILHKKWQEKKLLWRIQITCDLNRKTRHVSYAQKGKYIEGEESFSKKIGIRTCLLLHVNIELPVGVILGNWRRLRTLDLHRSGISILPYAIGKLLHLRYLDLSGNNDLKVLPKSITKLHNLQTLNLCECQRLKELPNDLSKLAKLRVLDIGYCDSLTNMPPDMGKLNCLYQLPLFLVSEMNSSSTRGVVDRVEDLKALTNLKGSLDVRIKIPKNGAYVKRNTNSDEEGYMRSKLHLESIEYRFSRENKEREGNEEYEEALLEDLQQPCPNLIQLRLDGYGGKRIPTSWMKQGNFGIFPSLEVLVLEDLPKLKGWWRDNDDDGSNNSSSSSRQPRVLPSFPRLSILDIRYCPELTRIPLCPTIRVLILDEFNERLQVIEIEIEKSNRDQERGPSTSTSTSTSTTTACSSIISGNWKLNNLTTDNVRGLNSVLPMPMEEAVQCLTKISISGDSELESMEQVCEVLQICFSLHTLHIWGCNNLRSLSMSNDDDDDGNMPWRCLHHTLRSLQLLHLPKVVKLPKGMQYLTSLQSLHILGCKALESIPGWMPTLTSLTQLEITCCSEELENRCQSPHGEDWPHIQHIPNLLLIHY